MKLLSLASAAVYLSVVDSLQGITDGPLWGKSLRAEFAGVDITNAQGDARWLDNSRAPAYSPRPRKVAQVDEIVINKRRHKMTGQKILGLMFVIGFMLASCGMLWASQRTAPGYCKDACILMRKTWPLILGNTLEWYEYGIYGYTALQIESNFFGGSALATWLGYAVSFLARPFGGLVLGWVADKYGRSVSVRLSLVGMVVATVGQGCLPGHHLGRSLELYGLLLLVIFRTLQGICAGGEVGAISAYMVEVSSKHTLGWACMLINAGASLGFGLAASVCDLLNRELGEEDMLTWGWRIPFLISLVPGLVAIIGRNLIPETEAFKEAVSEAEGFDEKSVAYDLLRHQYPALLVGGGATIGIATMWYVGTIWTASGLLEPNLGAGTALSIATSAQFLPLLFSPFVGMLTDIKGIAWVALAGSAFIAVTSLPVWIMIAFNPTSLTLAYLGIAGIFGMAKAIAGSTIYLLSAELFPTRLRTIGMGLSYNLAVSYFGGLGPALCEIFNDASKHYGPGIWMSFCGCLSVLALLWGFSLNRRGLLQLTHIRKQPYFGSTYGPDGRVICEGCHTSAH